MIGDTIFGAGVAYLVAGLAMFLVLTLHSVKPTIMEIVAIVFLWPAFAVMILYYAALEIIRRIS